MGSRKTAVFSFPWVTMWPWGVVDSGPGGFVLMKTRKGERERPCRRCQEPVRYIKSAWTAFPGTPYVQQRHGFHWVNAGDDSHHRCGDFVEVEANNAPAHNLDMAWREAMERDSSRTGVI